MRLANDQPSHLSQMQPTRHDAVAFRLDRQNMLNVSAHRVENY